MLLANVLNMQDEWGGWKAATTALWREHLQAATMVGRAAGAYEAQRLGYGIVPNDGPSGKLRHWAIAGVPAEAMAVHSKRAEEITERKVFARRDAIVALAPRLYGLHPAALEEMAERVLANPESVSLVAVASASERPYATATTIAREHAIAAAKNRKRRSSTLRVWRLALDRAKAICSHCPVRRLRHENYRLQAELKMARGGLS